MWCGAKEILRSALVLREIFVILSRLCPALSGRFYGKITRDGKGNC